VSRNPWQTRASRVVYENAWLNVREDQVIRPDGNPGIYGVVTLRPSACVLALNERDEAVLVGQWRYTLGRYSWELPRGGSHPGESDMLAVARRELAEETGVIAVHWEEHGSYDNANGVNHDIQTFFIATGLSQTERLLDPEEEIAVEWRPFDEIVAMAMDGRITEVCSVALILKAALLRSRKP
jgi:8-oxo-dGTP pyrophosphatase MutT (NUDIX family)